jgi:hypothetical protein
MAPARRYEMRDLFLLLCLLVMAPAAGYAMYRGFTPSARPSRFEGERTKNRLALLVAAESVFMLVLYLADTDRTIFLLVGIVGIAAAGLSYVRPATGAVPVEERLRRYRLTAVVGIAVIAGFLLMAANPEWREQILWCSGVGAAVVVAWGIAREILRRH